MASGFRRGLYRLYRIVDIVAETLAQAGRDLRILVHEFSHIARKLWGTEPSSDGGAVLFFREPGNASRSDIFDPADAFFHRIT